MDIVQLSVVEKENCLVIDSTLVANRLDVQHGDWIRNIVKKYQTKIEQRFGALRFENRVLKAGNGLTKQLICWLTEDQAIFVTTLSKNSDAVVDCKADIVAAFSEARQKNQSMLVVKSDDEIETLLMAMLDTRRQVKTLQQDNEYLKAEVAEIKASKQQAEQALKLLPAPEVTTPALEMRTQINRVVRDFVFKTSCDHQFAWRMLYREFRDLYHIDLYVRAKNSGMSKLDICEALGMLKDLYAVAYRLFVEAA